MMTSTRRTIWGLCLAGSMITAVACDHGAAAIEDDELGDELPPDGKNDSLKKPTAHGFIPFDRLIEVPFATKAQVHAYDFSVDGKVRITFDAAASFDTALYLYKEGDDGRWTKLERVVSRGVGEGDEPSFGDDLIREVAAGTYRVIVKSVAAGQTGRAMAKLECRGDACPSAQCLFGEVSDDFAWDEHSLLRAEWTKEIYEEDAADMTAITRAQFLAVAGVRSVADAFAETDEGVFTLTKLEDTLAGKDYYWIGFHHVDDSSRDGFFPAGSSSPVAVLGEDGIIDDCKVFW